MFERIRSWLAPSRTGRTAPHGGEQEGVRYRLHREEQVLALEVDDPFSARLSARASDVMGAGATGDSPFVSASVLALKAKQVDDGVYAAVELAAQRGAGAIEGKYALLHGILAHLDTRVSGAAPGAEGGGEARAVIDAASSLGGVHAPSPGHATLLRDEFLADELRSKPLGFYTWSDELARIFRQDRMLQTELSKARDLLAVAEVLRTDPKLRATYEACLRLPELLTNGLAAGDLRAVMGALDEGRDATPASPTAFFPASRAHETELVKQLFGDRAIPEGFDLSRELVSRIRSGAVDLTPRATSGWYDVQTWALETLAAPERGSEAARLVLDDGYREHLAELFRSILVATRETHVKQLETALAGCAAPRVVKLQVRPQLSVEPLVTYYQRRADSYRFVRAALVEVFGEEALGKMHGLRRGELVGEPVGVELAAMVHLFDGAAATAMRELGMSTEWDSSAFEAWRGGTGDPDVDADLRAMVPVFYDVARRQTKVWMIVGWVQRSLIASFATPPRVEVLGGATAEVELSPAWFPLATPVMVEAYVTRLLDRDAFRAHCDEHPTADAIVAALA
jgi:hypothetical protein